MRRITWSGASFVFLWGKGWEVVWPRHKARGDPAKDVSRKETCDNGSLASGVERSGRERVLNSGRLYFSRAVGGPDSNPSTNMVSAAVQISASVRLVTVLKPKPAMTKFIP